LEASFSSGCPVSLRCREGGAGHPIKVLRAAEQNRPDVAKARTEWREKQPSLNPGKLVFIDETWTKTNMTRLYGRAPRGHRVVDAVPHGHWKTSTFIGALRCDGLTAPGVFSGPINGELFLAYVEQILVPTLKRGMSSSWITSARTKLPECVRRSRPLAPL
jgi:hypothetical protein